MVNIETAWFPPDVTPLIGRPGEYEIFPDGRRWWNGLCWSEPYAADQSDDFKDAARKTPTPDLVSWRGLEHRFVLGQQAQTKAGEVGAIVDMRRSARGWSYRVGPTGKWLAEGALQPIGRGTA